jgi:hypothetical protein
VCGYQAIEIDTSISPNGSKKLAIRRPSRIPHAITTNFQWVLQRVKNRRKEEGKRQRGKKKKNK